MEKTPISSEKLCKLLRYRSDNSGYHLCNSLQVAKFLEKNKLVVTYSRRRYEKLHDGGIHTWDSIDNLVDLLATSKYRKTVIKYY